MLHRLLVELKKRGVPCVSLNTNLGSQDLDWGSEAFKARVGQPMKRELVPLRVSSMTFLCFLSGKDLRAAESLIPRLKLCL